MIVYYNARCSKCREAVGLLEENNCSFELREYLKVPPTQKELKELIATLGCKAIDIVRKKEPLFEEQYAGKTFTNAQWLKILSKNPILIERPIVIDGDKAVIGRPPLLVLDLVNKKRSRKVLTTETPRPRR